MGEKHDPAHEVSKGSGRKATRKMESKAVEKPRDVPCDAGHAAVQHSSQLPLAIVALLILLMAVIAKSLY